MGMKNGPMQGRCGPVAALAFLTPMMLFNASQALTLCVRHDGRVAIEALVNNRCPCEAHPAPTDPDNTIAGTGSRLAEEGCQSCTGLFLPVGLCRGRSMPTHTSPGLGVCPAVGSHGALSLPDILDVGEAVPFESPPLSICYHLPLNSTILRV